jgi:hypothetical protein
MTVRARSVGRVALTGLIPLCGACPTGAEVTPPLDTFGTLSNGDATDASADASSSAPAESSGEVSATTSVDATAADESSTTKPGTSDTDSADGSTGAPVVCGDDMIGGDELCDGAELGGEDCVSQGFVAGALACKKDCTFDTATCAANDCGNGLVEAPESCDGMDLAGQTCQSQGFTLGVLGCSADCSFATGACSNPSCGNAVIEQGEVCDGADLGGESCVSQGNPGGGILACLGNCSGYDTGGCACFDEDLGTATGPGVTSGDTTGGDDDLNASCGGVGGPDRVIEFTSTGAGTYTFDTFGSSFDTKIALYSDCATELACNDDSGGLQSQLSLDMNADQTVLVVVDGYGGNVGPWVLNVAAPGGAFPCQDQDIGGALGASVASGNTGVADEDLDPSCGLGNAADQAIRFTAPAAASYTFDTFGSGYDTVLSVWSDCSTQTACNDDSGVLQSQLVVDLAQGQAVLVLVDGYSGATGDWVLNIASG